MNTSAGSKTIRRHWQLYILVLPAVLYFLIFKYVPLIGIQIAFKDYSPFLGIWQSPFNDLENFKDFFNHYQFRSILFNTVSLSLYEVFVHFPFPILLALLMNQLRNTAWRRSLLTAFIFPYFISVVVLVGLINIFLAPSTGAVNAFIQLFTGNTIFFMGESEWFQTIYVFSGIWKRAGWGSLIYLGALSAIDPNLYDAANVDGAGRLKKIIHIDLPSIMPTIIVMLILSIGNIMSIGFEKSYLMQNTLNIDRSEIIATFVYKAGLVQNRFGFATAVDLFNGVINLILVVTFNKIARSLSENSLW